MVAALLSPARGAAHRPPPNAGAKQASDLPLAAAHGGTELWGGTGRQQHHVGLFEGGFDAICSR